MHTLQTFLTQISHFDSNKLFILDLMGIAVGTVIVYLILFYVLRPILREYENDIAFVTLNVSAYSVLFLFVIFGFKFSLSTSFGELADKGLLGIISHILVASAIVIISSLTAKLFEQVFIYYLKEYTSKSEVMWDDVLLPILSAITPVLIYIAGTAFFLSSIGVDLSGIWVALGGATFVLGFALQDILANFFSGIVLLIDSPFQFGDILLLEDGSIGALRKIGIRVTQVYVFSNHSDVYIPNSVLQGQKITNLSRPTTFYAQSLSIEIPSDCTLNDSKKLIEEVVLAHPDILGDIDLKLQVIDEYYIHEDEDNESVLIEQQELGKLRLLAEQEVNLKLEEIEQSLEALVATMQFAEIGGLTADEIENVQSEYQDILELMGFQLVHESNNRTGINFEENNEEGLIELIRQWYRILIKDPNLLDEDQNLIADEWERKINLLTRRTQRLSQKIANPQAEETRLDDYVLELIKWIQEKLKVPRKKWQEPQIRMQGMNHDDESNFFVELTISYFVDDIKLEDGKRGERVKSQIYQEIFHHFKNTYLDLILLPAPES